MDVLNVLFQNNLFTCDSLYLKVVGFVEKRFKFVLNERSNLLYFGLAKTVDTVCVEVYAHFLRTCVLQI